VNKKEAKKTSLIWARAGENTRASDSESFLLLFFKKEACPFFDIAAARKSRSSLRNAPSPTG